MYNNNSMGGALANSFKVMMKYIYGPLFRLIKRGVKKGNVKRAEKLERDIRK